MPTDRRRSSRETPDRRHEKRSDVPLIGYLVAVVGVAVLLAAFWALVYS